MFFQSKDEGAGNFLFKNPIWEGSVFDCPIYGRVQGELNLLTFLTIFALKNKKQLSLDKFRCFLRILLSVRIFVSVRILVSARINLYEFWWWCEFW